MFPSTGLVLCIKDPDSDLELWNSPVLNIIGHSILAIIVVYVVVLVTLCYCLIECSYHSICSVILILSLVILVCGLCDNYLNTLNVFTYSMVLFCAIGITGYIIEPVPHHHVCLGLLSQNIYDYPPCCLSLMKEPSVYVLLLIFSSILLVSKIGAPYKNLDLSMVSGSPCYNTSNNIIIHGSLTICLPIQDSSFASLVLGSLHLVSPVIIYFARIYEHICSSGLTRRNVIVLNKIVKYFLFLCATLSLFIMGSWMPSVFSQDYAYKNDYFSYLLPDSIPSIFGPWALLTTPLFLLCAIIIPRITPLLGKHKGLGSLLYAILWCVPALVMVLGFNLEALTLRTIALLLGNFSVPYISLLVIIGGTLEASWFTTYFNT